MDNSRTERLRKALDEAVDRAKAPGAAACVGNRDETFLLDAYGSRRLDPKPQPAKADTIYDLASVTKVVATTTAILLLRDDGAVDLDARVGTVVPIPAFGAFTFRHLLTHTAGLVAFKQYYTDASSLNEMLQRYAALELDWKPGTRWRYSDVGFMILGAAVELIARDRLDVFCAKRIFKPLGMKDTTFNPPADWADRCAATEKCAWRGKVMQGQVHDENAYAVGGVAGHAGLFSTANDLAVFCRALLSGKVLAERTLDEMTRLGQVPFFPWQGLGWELDPWASRSTGYLPTRDTFGHVGWTGTSLWIDRKTGLFAILLGNTCHPSRERRDNATFRQTFHDAVAREFFPGISNTHSGLDRLTHGGFEQLRERKMALLSHRAAVDELGRPILDVMGLGDITPRVIYSPEHGFGGQTEAGAPVGSAVSEKTPIVSLYGKRNAPTDKELKGIDLFVVDLQDVGSRYYTYAATMKDCMRACAKAGTPMLVLDRPNPIGGEILEGPIARNTASPVCWGAVPVRHGMTLGEIAQFFLAGEFKGSKLPLEVLPMDGWARDRLFNDCTLPWQPPSPNMTSPTTALLYVGMCLFEGTNLNEGRGTDTPFEVVGAPWLDAAAVIDAITPEERIGCDLEAISYTPVGIPGKASDPKHKDQQCAGIRIKVVQPREVRAFTLAVALLSAIRHLHTRQFDWDPSFDVLAGSGDLRAAIERGQKAADIIAESAPALRAFDEARPRLYG